MKQVAKIPRNPTIVLKMNFILKDVRVWINWKKNKILKVSPNVKDGVRRISTIFK